MGKEQQYRGITWTSEASLSRALGKNNTAFYNWKYKNPGKTERDYIDLYLDGKLRNNDTPKEAKTYRGVTWTNRESLGLALGKSKSAFYNWEYKNPGKTECDYIDFCLDEKQ